MKIIREQNNSEVEKDIVLAEYGIDEIEAAELRARLQAISEDWERPEMGAYDAL
jgi:hypothetical protein